MSEDNLVRHIRAVISDWKSKMPKDGQSNLIENHDFTPEYKAFIAMIDTKRDRITYCALRNLADDKHIAVHYFSGSNGQTDQILLRIPERKCTCCP